MSTLFEDIPLPGLDTLGDPAPSVSLARTRASVSDLLDGLNPQQREAVLHQGRRCCWWPAPARARPGC